MRRLGRLLLPLALCGIAGIGAPVARAARTICVGSASGCYATLQGAVDAAHDGDTIQIAGGTYAGGVTIAVSVDLVGAGAGRTVIAGGGPVLTIGTFGAAGEPTVSISRVTITGGVTHSSWAAAYVGDDVYAIGGGIEVPPAANFSTGATVAISDSVISGNRAAPLRAVASGIPCPRDVTISCIDGDLPFALAGGGGIDNWGAMTLSNTTVADNAVGGPVASDANAAGIFAEQGSLQLDGSTVSGNRATASAPNGRFADSGAIFAEGGSLTMSSSAATGNSATLNAALPSDVDLLAIAGGVHVSDRAKASIHGTTVSGNAVTMTNSIGDANAFSGGLHTDVDLGLSNDVLADNTVTVATTGHSRGNAAGDSGAGELGGSAVSTRISGNRVQASAVMGDASATAGGSIFAGSLTGATVRGNAVTASSPHGRATAQAGGLMAGDGGITAHQTVVDGNSAAADGRSGSARGGGIFDAAVPDGPPGGPLDLVGSSVTRNSLSASPGLTAQGGGIFATNPVSLTNTVVADNVPDQCVGC